MNSKVQEILRSLLDLFESGEIPEVIAIATFPIPDVPAARWSLLNRVLMARAGTGDARGYKQWEQVGRHVNKGAKSFRILAPRFKRGEDEETGETEMILVGFLAVPVFRLEDTDGAPLAYQQIELPRLPLQEVAEKWGLTVKAIPGNTAFLGIFVPSRSEILLATPDEQVFFHELAHAARYRVREDALPRWQEEMVVELAAATLCELVGLKPNAGRSYEYIASHAKLSRPDLLKACTRLMGEVETVLNEIISAAQDGVEYHRAINFD